MNIFVIDDGYDPQECARQQCDEHVKKMGLESCQILATCFTLDRLAESDCPRTQKNKPRKHFNPKHPSCKWANQSTGNVDWLIQHAEELFAEKYRRYPEGGRHFTHDFLDWVIKNVDDMTVPAGELTDFAVAIGDDKKCRQHPDFDSSDVCGKYRLFYIYDKPFATWKEKNKPSWMT